MWTFDNKYIILYSSMTDLTFTSVSDTFNTFLTILKMVARNEHDIDFILITFQTKSCFLFLLFSLDIRSLLFIIIIKLLFHFSKFIRAHQINTIQIPIFPIIKPLLVLLFGLVLIVFSILTDQLFLFLSLNIKFLEMSYILTKQSFDLKNIIYYLAIEFEFY